MEQIEQQVIEGLKGLSVPEQREVLDFVEFLQSKKQRLASVQPDAEKSAVSFLEAAGNYIGCVEGLEDLSTNPAYMDGYGA
ncbi:MAG: hypothetical protein VKL39_04535 [Leptolyngbyaceae bacterium]|nr:hypothetical protein [Leptolyngbyaceae bacterium]